jgi:putative CocE/NonD family hydrolase
MYKSLYSTQNYHIVAQDCRGTYDSGDKEKAIIFQKAYLDGADTISWIMEQPWCNGKIASVGASALALNQFFYAGMNPYGLVAQSLMVGTPDVYFMENMVINWLMGTASNYEYALNQIISHPKKDSYHNSTCLSMDIGPSFKKVSVPAIHVGGWYDTFMQGTLNGYMGYDDLGFENARGKQLLIMGPFTHGFPREGKVGEIHFPTKSISAFDLYLEWEQKLFDHVLLGSEFDWTGNRVAYYMMSSPDNEEDMGYRYARDWPIPYVNDTWYLNHDGLLLENFKGLTNKQFSYEYDPRDPVPTIGGNNLMLASGPYDQRSIEGRDDVILFESPTFTEPYEIVGHMWAHLTVKSDCPNTDFTVKITDVYPNGTSMLITDGIINAIRRNGFNKDAPPLNTAGVVEVLIDLWSTAYTFSPGHKIRVAISSSNYPRFAANPNTGAPQTVYSHQYLEKKIATNSILVGPSYYSYIILPTPI